MNISEWKKDFVDYLNLLNIPRDDYKGIISYIDEIPTVDAEPVRHGAWLPCDKKGYILTETALRNGGQWYGYKCSECNNIYHGNALTKYCPNCGAKMNGERKEE